MDNCSLTKLDIHMTKAFFLDRDGVINRSYFRDGKPRPPQDFAQFEFLPGVIAAIEQLKKHNYLALVVTNQPDVRTGVQSLDVVNQFHQLIMNEAKVDDIMACFHIHEDNCHCRKPKPGMLIELAEKHGVQLAESYMVGDRFKDLQAGAAAGCKTVLIGDGYGEPACPSDFQFRSLKEAVESLLP